MDGGGRRMASFGLSRAKQGGVKAFWTWAWKGPFRPCQVCPSEVSGEQHGNGRWVEVGRRRGAGRHRCDGR